MNIFSRLTDEMELIYNLRPQDKLRSPQYFSDESPVIREEAEQCPTRLYYADEARLEVVRRLSLSNREIFHKRRSP